MNKSKIIQKIISILSEDNPPIHFLERDEYCERYHIIHGEYSIIIDIDHIDIEISRISINKRGLPSSNIHISDEALLDSLFSLIKERINCVGSNKIVDDFLDSSSNISEMDKLILEEKYEEAAILKEKIEKIEKKNKQKKKKRKK